jgi:hypothetical protein
MRFSGTPLAKKLGIKPAIRFSNRRAERISRLAVALADGVLFVSKAKPGECAMVHLFAPMMGRCGTPPCRRAQGHEGRRLAMGVLVQTVRENSDRRDGEPDPRSAAADRFGRRKVCAVSDEWSGLKFVVRKALR